MSAVAEAASLLRQVAEPRPVGDTVKAAINRAARRVAIRPSRVEDIWREEAKAIRAEEMDAIRRAAAGRKAEEDARDTEAALAGLRALYRAYAEADSEFFQPQMVAIERFLLSQGAGASEVGEGGSAVAVPEEGR